MSILFSENAVRSLQSENLGEVRQATMPLADAVAAVDALREAAGTGGDSPLQDVRTLDFGPLGMQEAEVWAGNGPGAQLLSIQPKSPELSGCRYVIARGQDGTAIATAACPATLDAEPAEAFDAAFRSLLA